MEDKEHMGQVSEAKLADGGFYGAKVRSATVWLGIFYWSTEFIISSILWGILGVDPLESAIGKLILMLFSIAMTFAISFIIYRLHNVHLAVKIMTCFTLSLLAAVINAYIDFAIYYVYMLPQTVTFNWTNFGYTLVYGMSVFLGWSCLFVALLYSFEIRENERRLAASREEALSAQMRALRYQVNPHFLFNTLNSIAGLVEEGNTVGAGRMVLSLSSFLRTTLELDPLNDVRLADELTLQTGYLNIEGERFSDRMKVRVDVARELENALVPSLILQPLIENAVKHGVSDKPGMVEILISAGRVGEVLNLSVENDVSDAPNPRRTHGMGIGLKNVAHRMETRFPGAGSCVAGYVTPSRFKASLTMPLRLA